MSFVSVARWLWTSNSKGNMNESVSVMSGPVHYRFLDLRVSAYLVFFIRVAQGPGRES